MRKRVAIIEVERLGTLESTRSLELQIQQWAAHYGITKKDLQAQFNVACMSDDGETLTFTVEFFLEDKPKARKKLAAPRKRRAPSDAPFSHV